MIGQQYWSTGVVVDWNGDDEKPWAVTLNFYDEGFCDAGSSEGTLHARYRVADLSRAIIMLVRDADRLGIIWRDPTVYFEADGEEDAPGGWRELVAAEAARLGWRQVYSEDEDLAEAERRSPAPSPSTQGEDKP